jgi:hypothetical protein
MPAHSRSKNGVASLAYVAGIHVFLLGGKDVDGRDKPGHDGFYVLRLFKNSVRFLPAPIMKAKSAPAIRKRQPMST